jgi:transketolase
MREGDDLTIVAYGQMVARALQAADLLAEEGMDVRVLNMSTIEPLDSAQIDQAAEETGALLVAEEHQLDGGLGESIARYLAGNNPVPMGFIAMPNAFGESGDPDELMVKYRLDVDSIVRKALRVHGRKTKG